MKPKEKSHRITREPLTGRRGPSTQGCIITVHEYPGQLEGNHSMPVALGGGGGGVQGLEHHDKKDHIQNKLHELDLTSRSNEDERGEQKTSVLSEVENLPDFH